MNLAPLIDHTLLKPDAVIDDIRQLCKEAAEHQFCSVCVNPYWISTAKQELSGSQVKVCTVIGFPLGAALAQSKAHEAADALKASADELDIVINIGAAKEGHWNFIEHEIHEIASLAKGHVVKVILETCLLEPEQIRQCCLAAKRAGASFVKTSTGFSKSGATTDVVKLMRETVGPEMGVKASGGIRDTATAMAMVEAGATRLGTSSGIAIIGAAVAAPAGSY